MTKKKEKHHKDQQFTTQKSKDEATRTSQEIGWCSGRVNIAAPSVAPVVLLNTKNTISHERVTKPLNAICM